MAKKTAIQNFKLTEQEKKDFNNLCQLTHTTASSELQNFVREKIILMKQSEITKDFLILYGWKQDEDLYWHKNNNEYNYIDGILTLHKTKTIHQVFKIEQILLLTQS